MPSLRRHSLVVAASLTLACGDGNGPDHPPLHLTATVNSASWRPDTAIAIAFGAPTDTTLSVTAVRRVSNSEEQQISFHIHSFTGPGPIALGDSSSAAIGAYSVSQISGGVVVSSTTYLTQASPAGLVTITRLDRTDSTVAGSFAFEAAVTPDTAPHQLVSGSFRLRLQFVPVFGVP